MSMQRRTFIQAVAGASAAVATGACSREPVALAEGEGTWLALLGTNLEQEHDYRAEVEGTIPSELRGTLYRNGPGLFERDGYRKATLLDGDGMLQAIDFGDQGVRYRNRFVRTEKFLAEERAGRFLEPTWTTLAPRFYENWPGFPKHSQAGVTTYLVNGKLYAIDEAGDPWVLDPDSLDDHRPEPVLPGDQARSYKAHTKFDASSGDWVLLGWSTGRTTDIDVVIKDAAGGLKLHRRVPSPRGGYIHDFFNSENHVVVLLHAVSSNPFPMLAGLESFADTLSWKPELGNTVLVIPKDDSQPVRSYEASASFMWHSFNAYEQGTELIADFVGYDEPDHFLGENATLRTIMQGRLGDSRYPGTIRRYRMDLSGSRLQEELVSAGNFEFPIVHRGVSGRRHSYGFATTAATGRFFHSGIAGIDFQSGKVESFDFGQDVHVGEPIFVPTDERENQGYLLSMALDGQSGRSFVAVMDAGQLGNGPLARIWLQHHTPLSFHGDWRSA